MKIAITGGAGFIGTHLTKAYLDAGHDVLIIDSLLCGSRQEIDPRARFYQMDIRDHKLHTLLQQERPNIVSHHASQQLRHITGEHALPDADVHVRGLLNVLDGCVSASVHKLIFASGGNSLYGQVDAEQPSITEDVALCPRCPSDISKVAGEWYVRYYTQQYGLKHTILRYADTYGETASMYALFPHHPISYYIRMLAEKCRPIINGSGDEICDHIFIDDVVRANFAVLKRGDNQTFHISSGSGNTLKQLYHMVALLLESTIEPIHLSGPLIKAPAVVLDNTRAQRMLGWHPEVTLLEGIRLATARLVPPKQSLELTGERVFAGKRTANVGTLTTV